MSRRKWSPAADAKLRKLYPKAPWPKLCFQLKRTENAIKQHARKLGISRPKVGYKLWTPADVRLLRKRYPNEGTASIARDLGRTIGHVHQKATGLGLHKTKKFLASEAYKGQFREKARTDPRMIAGRFKKGLVPPNKGLRRPGWAPGRMAETQFKKGRTAEESRNYVPIGTEKVDPKRKVLMRKVTDDPTIFPVNRWRPVHVLVWEAANGPVPPGHICIFRPGMKTFVASEITADKLELVTHAENMRRNTIHNYPPEIKQAMYARIHLLRSIRAHEKRGERA